MKHSKSYGGAGGGSAGLLSNYDAYQRWVRAAHERVVCEGSFSHG
jgi:hypothetical protein